VVSRFVEHGFAEARKNHAVPAAALADPTGDPEFRHPLVKGHGGIVVLPDAAEPPREAAKVLLDLTSDEKKGEVLKGLDRAATIANLYEQAGVGPSKGMRLAVVVHGPATTGLLTDEGYARHGGGAENPNREPIRRLREAGVEIYVCGQALARQKYRTDEVSPDVTVAVSAATVHINKQTDGYVLVP
jgi:intracellular sulfur oxidation DsrE/DsrF family protein